MKLFEKVIDANDLVFAFLVVGVIMYLSYWVARHFTNNKIPGAAIAITSGLILAFLGGKKGIADVPLFSGMALLGGAMMRDFSVVATAMGANYGEIKKAGLAAFISLLIGVFVAFFAGGTIGYAMGYTDIKDFTTIGAGACSFIVGPITGSAIGAGSDVIAISIAIGVVKSIMITIGTPIVAKQIGLDNPHAAMVFGGLIGTTSGVAAGLAATNPKLVPYGALTATFYTGIGALLCPSVFYLILQAIL
ncbi:MAG TPA: malonate transporter subunit MadM [Cytophagales bacterium]|nr:malonate transporter subunit MadM [Cytophagales bacterium]HCR55026.1 malonate transporter subunit MadM [Cytophagales bacterium]